jgi:hypothetical protein
MFVHGVSPGFLEVGRAKAAAAAEGQQPFGKGAYFLGKVRCLLGGVGDRRRFGTSAARVAC